MLTVFIYTITRHVKVVKVDRESRENKLTVFPRDLSLLQGQRIKSESKQWR